MTQKASAGPHWADAAADAAIASGRPGVVSSGISPSGEIHIGNMREVLTADALSALFDITMHPAAEVEQVFVPRWEAP